MCNCSEAVVFWLLFFGCFERNFSAMDHNNWLTKKWPLELLDSSEYSILQNIAEKPTQNVSDEKLLEEIVGNSEIFPIEFPVNSIRIKELQKSVDSATLSQNVISTYPVMHERTLGLFSQFLHFKRKHGSSLEKNLYKDMNILDLVDRILLKRSVSFGGRRDWYMLLSKQRGQQGWESVGTSEEVAPLLLKDCLSYDELKLSAMLYVSGRTMFINDGNRYNRGIVDPNLDDNVQREGVIVGLIGTRCERAGVMESAECIITKEQNSVQNGFGHEAPSENDSDQNNLYLWRQLWFNFYKADSLTYSDAYSKITEDSSVNLSKQLQASLPFVSVDDKFIFNNELYSKRMGITFDVLLLESNERAKEIDTTAYVHVVGLGLGVWLASPHQTNVFVKTFLLRMIELMPQLHSVSDVHFAYFHDILPEIATDGMILEDNTHPLGGIKVHISKREPSSKLTGVHSGKLVVESYAWDGNALPGNEFWLGSLQGSGDPAAACSTQVAELHNAHINKDYTRGKNLHIAGRFGVKHIAEHCKLAAAAQTPQE